MATKVTMERICCKTFTNVTIDANYVHEFISCVFINAIFINEGFNTETVLDNKTFTDRMFFDNCTFINCDTSKVKFHVNQITRCLLIATDFELAGEEDVTSKNNVIVGPGMPRNYVPSWKDKKTSTVIVDNHDERCAF
jgi:hypothetical protein